MKAVQVLLDEELLNRLAQSPEVKEAGRSEVVRRAVRLYLQHRESEAIAEQYRQAYRDRPEPDEDLDGWAQEGQWPDE